MEALLFVRLRAANTDPSGMFSLAAILRSDNSFCIFANTASVDFVSDVTAPRFIEEHKRPPQRQSLVVIAVVQTTRAGISVASVQSGSLTHIAATNSVLLCTRMTG